MKCSVYDLRQAVYSVTVISSLFVASTVLYNERNVAVFSNDVITKVILVTHYRSGSTLLGDVIRQGDGVFYWFEPLFHPSNELARNNNVVGGVFIQSVNNGSDLISLPENYVRAATKLLKDLLNCHLTTVPFEVLVTSIKSYPYLQTYRKCLSSNVSTPLDEIPADVRSACLPLAERLCRQSKLRIVKTIRVSMEWLSGLAKTEPNMRFIYMLRDPRGRLWSLIGKRVRDQRESVLKYIEQEQTIWCRRLMDDWVWINKFRRNHSDRLLVLRYEDLATNFMPQVRRIYSFIGKDTRALSAKWLVNRTMAKQDGGRMSTFRRNSSKTALRWRHEMPSWVKGVVSKACHSVLERWNLR